MNRRLMTFAVLVHGVACLAAFVATGAGVSAGAAIEKPAAIEVDADLVSGGAAVPSDDVDDASSDDSSERVASRAKPANIDLQ